MVLSNNQEAMDLLRALAAEITDNGADMGKLQRTQIDLAAWLAQWGRYDESNAVANMPQFNVQVSEKAVYLGIGPGYSHRVELVDFAAHHATRLACITFPEFLEVDQWNHSWPTTMMRGPRCSGIWLGK